MILKVNIKDVKKNKKNPRVIKGEKFKQLIKSIEEFPQMMNIRPIVVDSNMEIIGGNMRFEACKELGWTEIPVIKSEELTDEQKKQFVIKDNVSFGEWDWNILESDWQIDEVSEWGVEFGFETLQETETPKGSITQEVWVDYQAEEREKEWQRLQREKQMLETIEQQRRELEKINGEKTESFTPTIQPSQSKGVVTEESVQSTYEKLKEGFKNKNFKMVDMVCPNCGEEFSVEGNKLNFNDIIENE